MSSSVNNCVGGKKHEIILLCLFGFQMEGRTKNQWKITTFEPLSKENRQGLEVAKGR